MFDIPSADGQFRVMAWCRSYGHCRRGVMTAAAIALMLGGCDVATAPPAAQDAITRALCPAPLTDRFVWVPPARIMVGGDARLPEEGPPREVAVAGFWISRFELTNAEFAAFVRATGYRTLAELPPPDMPGAPPDMQQPGSAVFAAPTRDAPQWWRWVVGANWQHPSGPDSSISGKDGHPVVQIAEADARAYAEWANLALPSEAQWESAARQGGADPREPVDAAGRPTANYYQGVFPVRDLGRDGFRGTAPVGCFPANRAGAFDMIGNVWEWTHDASRPGSPSNIIKGGSYLCAANYCARYRPAARQFQERDLGTDHIGVRLIDPRRPPPEQPNGDRPT